MVEWDTWIFITVRKIRAILRNEFFSQVEHKNHMDWIAHPLEIHLSKEHWHGWGWNSTRLWYEQWMVTPLVTAAVVTVILPVVVQKSSFSADWEAGYSFAFGRPGYPFGVSGAHEYLSHSDKSPFCCCTSGSIADIILPWRLVSFREVLGFVVKLLYQNDWQVFNFHLTLQSEIPTLDEISMIIISAFSLFLVFHIILNL